MTHAEALRWVARGRIVITTRVVVDPETGAVYGGVTITVGSTP